MPFLGAVRGAAETGVERQKLAYKSLLERKSPAGQYQQARTAAIPQEMQIQQQQLGLQQQQEQRLKQQQAGNELNNAYTRLKSVTNQETGGPLSGRETEYYAGMSQIFKYTSAFKVGGALSDTEGKNPSENVFLKAGRNFANKPSPKNWLEVMKAVEMMPKGTPETPRGSETERFRADLVKARSGQISFNELKNMYPDKESEISTFERATMPAQKAPGFREARGLVAKFGKERARITPTAQRMIDQIKTQADMDEFLEEVNKKVKQGYLTNNDKNTVLEYFGIQK